MNDTLGTRQLGPDSDGEFENASDGEQYESMELPSTSLQEQSFAHSVVDQPLAETLMVNKSSTSLNASKFESTTIKGDLGDYSGSSPSSPAFSINQKTTTTAFNSFRTSPVMETQQALDYSYQTPSRVSGLSNAGQSFSHGGRRDNLDRGFYDDDRSQDSGSRLETSRYHNSNNSLNTKETDRGWGSLSSWINTAVSTVSEVIENPNVVVSKAHTLGQGIRNVANERIDRVYESLDPEYEYARERQIKHGAPAYSPQHQLLQRESVDLQTGAVQTRMHSGVPAADHQTTRESFNGDASFETSAPLYDLQHSRNPANEHTSQPSVISNENKLAYKDDNSEKANDDWGNDAWGDGWDDQGGHDLLLDGKESLSLSPSNNLKDSYSLGPDIPITVTHVQDNFSPAPSTQVQDSQAFSPTISNTGLIPDSTRSVKDLFSIEPANRTSRSKAAPSKRDDDDRSSQTTPRSLSSDMRPTDTLFSTLDFASNALGSAMLGVHRKVTQVSQSQSLKNTASGDATQSRPVSPAWGNHQPNVLKDARDVPGKLDRTTSANHSLEEVGGNVVSTGLGALEILGKRAVDVISDVRRAGQLSHGHGNYNSSSDQFDENDPFKIPPKMNLATLFDDAGGPAHLNSMRSAASASTATVSKLVSQRPKILQMGQIQDLEQLLGSQSLDSALGEITVDLLAGHKDFRSIVVLLDKMGVQGTSHLRQLRISTKKHASLTLDSVNAFEQEWHNHQSRASERDFFAKAPIKKFFESRLLSIYFDSVRSLSQFTYRTCLQLLKISDSFSTHLNEKISGTKSSPGVETEGDRREDLSPMAKAKILRQFIGNLIAETKFIVKSYSLTLDSVLEAAKGFTTPLDRLDWEDLSMGLEKIKALLTERELPESLGFIHTGAYCIAEVLKNELMIDALHGKIVPESPRSPISQPNILTAPSQAQSHPRETQQVRSAQKPSPVSYSTSTLPLPTDQGSGLRSPSLTPRSPSPLLTNIGDQTGSLAPTTPVNSVIHGSKDATPSVTSDNRPSSNVVNSARSNRPPPSQPKLSDEDFFSILNSS
ncbi:hypothetical protein BGZ46_001967 [Entomortierella lignicola]|nr:hypothetical protein BGZ46_001967 [Entomortierella lignicola]